jgi:Rrf2 family protein
MKLSHASAYALTNLVHLAREQTDRPVPSHEAAREEGLPERMLLKVLKPLVGAGVLRSVRGTSGGYTLARPPKDVTLLEVVEAVDGPLRGGAGAVGRKGPPSTGDSRRCATRPRRWCGSGWRRSCWPSWRRGGSPPTAT